MEELYDLKNKIALMKDDYRKRIQSGKEMIADLEKEKVQTISTISAVQRLNMKVREYKRVLSELNQLT